jgi:hypothetical protein
VSVRWSGVQQQLTGGVRPNANENGQIRPSTAAQAVRRAGGRPHLEAVLRKGWKSDRICVRSGFIGGIPVDVAYGPLAFSQFNELMQRTNGMSVLINRDLIACGVKVEAEQRTAEAQAYMRHMKAQLKQQQGRQ